jgi:hypothetical protein
MTNRERSDPAIASAIIRSLFEGIPESIKQSYFDFLAADIEFLSLRHPDRWGITLFESAVCLNVGWCECLILHGEGLRILVERTSAPIVLDRKTYRSAPGCGFTTIPLSQLTGAFASVEAAHHDALSIAARWSPSPTIRNAHSPGIPALLSQLLHRRIRNPSYLPSSEVFLYLDEESTGEEHSEGARTAVLVNRFERSPRAREACISHHGVRCAVCEMSFGDRYGEAIKDFIHVHHLVPLSAIGVEYCVNPVADLRPVCPNCHAVIHHHPNRPLSIEQARDLLR